MLCIIMHRRGNGDEENTLYHSQQRSSQALLLLFFGCVVNVRWGATSITRGRKLDKAHAIHEYRESMQLCGARVCKIPRPSLHLLFLFSEVANYIAYKGRTLETLGSVV